MSGYKLLTRKDGTFRYTKNGKLISKDNIPEETLKKLHGEEVVDKSDSQPQSSNRPCVFCGAFSKYTRFLNMQTVYICEDHYYSETIGKVAAKLKEKQHAV